MGKYADELNKRRNYNNLSESQKKELSRQKNARSRVRNEERKKKRDAEIAIRMEIRNSRSNTEQIEELDRRLGKGVGAIRERLKLSQSSTNGGLTTV